MATDDSTSLALQNLGFLNKQFSDAVAPVNNFASQNLQLAVSQKRAEQEQQNRLEQLQFASRLEGERQASQNAAALHHAVVTGQISKDHALELQRLAFAHEDDRAIKTQADAIRSDPQAKRILAKEIEQLPDTPSGNRALVAAKTQKFADPKVASGLARDEAVTLTKQIKEATTQLTSTVVGSPQSRQTILNFLKTPGMADLLISKGKLSSQDIQAFVNGGDVNKVATAIKDTAERATWFYGSNDKIASQMTTALAQAAADAGAVQSPDQLANMNLLGTLMKRRDDLLTGGNLLPEDQTQVFQASGMAMPKATIIPKPTTTAQPQAEGAAAPNPLPNYNPFNTPSRDASKTGPLVSAWNGLSNFRTAATGLERGLADPDPRAFAFDRSQRFAADPATEFAVRKTALDTFRQKQAVMSGITSAIPGIKTFQPTYDAFAQQKDEDALKQTVMGLYSSPSPVMQDMGQALPFTPYPVQPAR